jgi:hypothetical protein
MFSEFFWREKKSRRRPLRPFSDNLTVVKSDILCGTSNFAADAVIDFILVAL